MQPAWLQGVREAQQGGCSGASAVCQDLSRALVSRVARSVALWHLVSTSASGPFFWKLEHSWTSPQSPGLGVVKPRAGARDISATPETGLICWGLQKPPKAAEGEQMAQVKSQGPLHPRCWCPASGPDPPHPTPGCERDRLSFGFCETLRLLGRCQLPTVRAQCCSSCTPPSWGAPSRGRQQGTRH